MSVWSTIRGTISVPFTAHFSLNKYTSHTINQEYVLKVHEIDKSEDSYIMQFTLDVVTDGVDASFVFNRYMSGIPGSYDLETRIRHSGEGAGK